MTNANTMQASKKFRKRCPCQKFLVDSAGDGEGNDAVTTVDALGALGCCISSSSVTTFTFSAVELHISQILKIDIFELQIKI